MIILYFYRFVFLVFSYLYRVTSEQVLPLAWPTKYL